MKRILILFFIFSFCAYLIAGESAGTAGMQFLKIGADARGNSLSGAVTSEVTGIEALYWNPGGLNGIKEKEVLITYNRWIANMNYIYAGFGMKGFKRGKRYDRIGIGVIFMDEGKVEATDSSSGRDLELGSYDLGIILGYGMQIWKILSGISIKIINKNVFGYNSTGVVMDIGGQMGIEGVKGLRAGIVVKNIGITSKVGEENERVPIMVMIGGSYEKEIKGGHRIEGMLSSDIMIDEMPYINTGIEYGYKGVVFMRVGYRVETGGNRIGWAKGLSVGIGGALNKEVIKNIKDARIDITYLPMLELGNIMQISLKVKF